MRDPVGTAAVESSGSSRTSKVTAAPQWGTTPVPEDVRGILAERSVWAPPGPRGPVADGSCRSAFAALSVRRFPPSVIPARPYPRLLGCRGRLRCPRRSADSAGACSRALAPVAVVPRSRALHLAERRSTAVHGGGKYLGRKAFGQRGDDGCPRWSLVRCEPHWHRSAGGTSRSAWSMWAPQPAHVGRPHFEHRIAWHIPPRVSGRFHPGKQKLCAPSPTALGPAAPPL